MITLLLATANRPEMLRTALRSAERQTAKEKIGTVIVSENGGNDKSRGVCAEFPGLPIRYVFRNPPVAVMEHARALFAEAGALPHPYIASLHDDDWWAPEHLAAALQALDCHPQCSAIYSSYYQTSGPQNPFVAPNVTWLVWISSGCDFRQPILVLEKVSVMLACLIATTLHYSTLVGRREAMCDAWPKIIETNNTFDNDRTFPVFLSLAGPIGYLVRPDTFVRLHLVQDSKRPPHVSGLWPLTQETTRWLLRAQPKTVALAAEKFNETMARLRLQALPELRHAIFERAHEPQWTTLRDECGLKLPRREDFQNRSTAL